MITVRWLGATGLEFSYENHKILMDPYLSRPGKIDIIFRKIIPNVSIIENYAKSLKDKQSSMIVSHTHLDHALDCPDLSRYINGPVIGSRSLEVLMSLHEIPHRVRMCSGGETIEIDRKIKVTMLRSIHGLVAMGRIPYPGEIIPGRRIPPLRASAYRHGTVFMCKLEIGDTTFMHVGSANFIESEIKDQRCDVLFLCVPGWKRIPNYPGRLVEIFKPQTVIPFHFDDFSAPLASDGTAPKLPFQDLPGFLEQIRQVAPDVKIIIPETYQVMTF
ncbi:MBL fold metallo-hydrolase [Deltaproteobacteria bacterium TL4]